MKLLGLLRHAKSDWDDIALRDFDRGLNKRGRKGAALMGAHIADHGVQWKKLVASPAERVRATLDAAQLDLPQTLVEEAYLADSPTLMRLIRQHGGDADSLLLAGHNPGLQELALELVTSGNENELFEEVAAKYPTASFTVIELDIPAWTDCMPGCGRIVHFARPRDLDPELGPERVR